MAATTIDQIVERNKYASAAMELTTTTDAFPPGSIEYANTGHTAPPMLMAPDTAKLWTGAFIVSCLDPRLTPESYLGLAGAGVENPMGMSPHPPTHPHNDG
jgi:hypothetical protein